MAFAKPVIAVLEGDGRAELSNAEGGIFATQQDSKSLSSAIKSFKALSENERKRLGNNNLAYYINHFSLESASRNIEAELIRKSR